MGKVIAMTKCPFHGDTDPSLAIYENGYYCFGCHKSGKLEQWMTDLAHQKPVSQSSINTISVAKNVEQYTYMYSQLAIKFFEDRKILTTTAEEFGCKYNDNKLLLETWDMAANLTGRQIRFLNRKPKYRLVPVVRHKTKVYPTYTRCLPEEEIKDYCFIVESVYDAMRMWQGTGFPSVAILGTNIKTSLLMQLSILSKLRNTTFIVYFDPDAKVITKLISDKMRAYGLRTVEIYPKLKPYEYTDNELESQINEVL
jgi:DNA primase